MSNPICIGTWDCSINLLAYAGIFFISAILRRQLVDNADMDFSLIGGTILGIAAYVIILLIFSSQKWSFLVSLLGIIIGGFFGGALLGSGGGDSFN